MKIYYPQTSIKLISKSDVVIHLSANPGVQLSIESPELDLKENLFKYF